MESTSDVQVAESQARTPQTIQRIESSIIPASGGTTMGEAPEVTVSDPSSGLPAFLACFDLLELNSLPVSHFYRFGPPMVTFCTSLCLWRVCHCWKGCSKSMETSLVGLGEVYF